MEHKAALGRSAKWVGTMSCLAVAGARAGKRLVVCIERQRDRLRRGRWDGKVERALARLASGYTACDVITEYDAKNRKVCRRVIEREVPPDPQAVKFYLANRWRLADQGRRMRAGPCSGCVTLNRELEHGRG